MSGQGLRMRGTTDRYNTVDCINGDVVSLALMACGGRAPLHCANGPLRTSVQHMRQLSVKAIAKDAERLRLETLYSYEVLDTPPEEQFDRITRLAKAIFRAPISQISFIDEHRQWFKSCANPAISETPRNDSFCNHTIKGDCPLIVPDARADPRFRDLPRVVGKPHIRSYFGAPLRAPNGQNIGALYVVDTEVRHPSAEANCHAAGPRAAGHGRTGTASGRHHR